MFPHVSVSRSKDGGRTWSEPVTVMKGNGNSFGQANQAVFYDKEWLTVDNNPDSPFYGRAYLTSDVFTSAEGRCGTVHLTRTGGAPGCVGDSLGGPVCAQARVAGHLWTGRVHRCSCDERRRQGL